MSFHFPSGQTNLQLIWIWIVAICKAPSKSSTAGFLDPFLSDLVFSFYRSLHECLMFLPQFRFLCICLHLNPVFPHLYTSGWWGGRPSSKTMIWMKTCFETHWVFLLLVRPIEMTGRALLIKHPRDAQSIKNRNSVSRCDYLVEESVQTFLLKILERLSFNTTMDI